MTKVIKNELIVQDQQTPTISITPMDLMKLGIDKGLGIAELEKLMDLQDRWEKKQARKDFFDALSKFQTIVPDIKKTKIAKINSQKGFFSYNYADLGSIAKCIKDSLNECGLSYRWQFKEVNNKLVCDCLVSHRSGHTETTTMEAGKDNSGAKNDIQQTGSTQTYLQRYTLIGALGLSTAQEDNDGKTSKPVEKEKPADLDNEEYIDQWKQTISDVKTQIELTKLYKSNKKVIDGSHEIQSLMKTRQEQLKATSVQTKTSLP